MQSCARASSGTGMLEVGSIRTWPSTMAVELLSITSPILFDSSAHCCGPILLDFLSTLGKGRADVLLQLATSFESVVSTEQCSSGARPEMHIARSRFWPGSLRSPPSLGMSSSLMTAAKASRSAASKRLCGGLSLAGQAEQCRSFVEALDGPGSAEPLIAIMPMLIRSLGSRQVFAAWGDVLGLDHA